MHAQVLNGMAEHAKQFSDLCTPICKAATDLACRDCKYDSSSDVGMHTSLTAVLPAPMKGMVADDAFVSSTPNSCVAEALAASTLFAIADTRALAKLAGSVSYETF